MGDLKRYCSERVTHVGNDGMSEDELGDYVRYEDVDRLLAIERAARDAILTYHKGEPLAGAMAALYLSLGEK